MGRGRSSVGRASASQAAPANERFPASSEKSRLSRSFPAWNRNALPPRSPLSGLSWRREVDGLSASLATASRSDRGLWYLPAAFPADAVSQPPVGVLTATSDLNNPRLAGKPEEQKDRAVAERYYSRRYRALPALRLTAEQILERLVANRVEVGVPPCHLSRALPHLDRAAEVLDGVCGLARQALAAGRVVVELSVVGWSSISSRPLSAASAYLPAS